MSIIGCQNNSLACYTFLIVIIVIHSNSNTFLISPLIMCYILFELTIQNCMSVSNELYQNKALK